MKHNKPLILQVPSCQEFIPDIAGDLFLFLDESTEYYIFPGFCDVHVHFREPGFLYKESIKSGSMAAAAGGYTDVCTMPNLFPVPDSPENLRFQTDCIKKDAVINVYPYGSITKGENGTELSAMDEISGSVIAFSDDGKPVMDSGLMEKAMLNAKRLGKIIAAHCEDLTLVSGGCINECAYSAGHGFKGISNESEWRMIERDLLLAEKTGCRYHVCHVSTSESVDLIRKAKKRGVDVTCETAPHYLLLDDSCLKDEGAFKMNPPIRSRRDRDALTEGILDGTVDMIATDHAPHSEEEKSLGLEKSLFGITGIETAFQVLYTGLVKTGVISIDKLVELISLNPRKRFGIQNNGSYTLWDLSEKTIINPATFLSGGKSTPFADMEVFGKCKATVCCDRLVYKNI